MSKRFPDNTPVSITIPAELADALLAHGDRLIDALKHQAVLAEMSSTESRSAFKADVIRRRQEHRLIGVQAYRCWRRLDKTMFKSRHAAMKSLAQKFQLNKSYIEMLIGNRRKAVDEYLSRRRAVAVATLYLQGKSNEQISSSVGVSKTSIKRIIHNNKEIVERVRWRLREQEARQ